MERRKFIKSCCTAGIGIPFMGTMLLSCESLYYAKVSVQTNKILVSKSEFAKIKDGKTVPRKFVLIKTEKLNFPICVYRIEENKYVSSLLMCTHQKCELNVAAGQYSCPCHGSEFSINGKVLEGPAENNLVTYKTTIENEQIIVHIP